MEKFHLQNKTNRNYSYDLPKRAYLAHEKEIRVWLLLPAPNKKLPLSEHADGRVVILGENEFMNHLVHWFMQHAQQ